MELHKAIRKVVSDNGKSFITDLRIINHLLDYQAFKDKPAMRLILRDIINSGYAEEMLSLDIHNPDWSVKLKQFEHEFIDSCGYKEDLSTYVFQSLAYGIGLEVENKEPEIKQSANINIFFPIPETSIDTNTSPSPNVIVSKITPSDLYTMALAFFNDGNYQQANDFVDKYIATSPQQKDYSRSLKLKGDILMKLDKYEEAILIYNDCFTQKANEMHQSIDVIRDSFKKHEIKGYENILFNYYYCLLYSQKINNSQWELLVKEEARNGISDAINYCAKHGINPIDSHFNVYFSDRNMLKTDDYLYTDGTFSHEYSNTKKALAKIVLMETSNYEKSQGWTHGYIIPLRGRVFIDHKLLEFQAFDVCQWSKINVDLPFPHSHYTSDDLNHWDKIQKIESEHLIEINDLKQFPAFNVGNKYNQPLKNVSKWFVPSIHHIMRFIKCGRKYGYYFSGDTYWTSSQADSNNAICFRPRYDDGRYGRGIYENILCESKTESHIVHPIAAF